MTDGVLVTPPLSPMGGTFSPFTPLPAPKQCKVETDGFLLDWITARIPEKFFTGDEWRFLMMQGDRIMRFNPRTGVTDYEIQAWDSIRSDSHSVTYRVGADALWIQGSPARAIGQGDAVFGAGASSDLNISGSLQRMVAFIGDSLGIDLIQHSPSEWIVTRIDVTANMDLGSEANVRSALSILRNTEGGRYRMTQNEIGTVYWSNSSKLRSGKAYGKGQHLRHLMRKKDYDGYQYSPKEILAADRLLRLELSLKREFFARHDWRLLDADYLVRQWRTYFERMIGDNEVENENDLIARVYEIAETKRKARAALNCWSVIKAEGRAAALNRFSKTTYYRHVQLLKAAGLSDSDIGNRKIVAFRQKIFTAQIATGWNDLLKVA